MATKKQKRAAGLAKRLKESEELAASGLEAQERDHQHRAAESVAIKAQAAEINDRHRAILARHGIHE